MSASAWIRRHLYRPVAARERRARFALSAAGLLAAALLLSMSSREVPHALRANLPAARGARVESREARQLSGAALRAARQFLDGYLAYLYGRGSARGVSEVTPALARSLERHPPLVPAAMRKLRPRILRLTASSSSSGTFTVIALVKDGEVLAYPIRLQLLQRGGRLLVSGLGQA